MEISGLWMTVVILVVLLAGMIYLTVGTLPGKMMAIAQAAYREAVRQPLFWFLLAFSALFMFLAVFLQYFTFGEDLKVMKDLELDAILVATLILTVFSASISISEELEGRTAITLLSKPISRRQFLLGKFTGILLAAMLMALLLSLLMGWTIHFKIDLDKLDRPPDPIEIGQMQDALSFLPTVIVNSVRYVLRVIAQIQAIAPALVLSFCQVMILTSIAVALATRLPMVLNLVVCGAAFVIGRLTHVLVAQAQSKLIEFVGNVFAILLPGLNYYDVGPAIVSDVTVPWIEYVLPAAVHAVIYTVIALLFGLILFEDRDLA